MSKIVVGKIVNTFGLKGDLKVLPQDKIFDSISDLKEFWIDGFENVFVCEKISYNGKFAKLKIVGYDDINLVLMFKNKDILIDEKNERKLGEDEYLTMDIIGSKVFDKDKQIGEIVDVENFGATDILVLNLEGREARVPFVQKFFEVINPKEKLFVISKHFFEGVV